MNSGQRTATCPPESPSVLRPETRSGSDSESWTEYRASGLSSGGRNSQQNSFRLLENGEGYFPRVFEAIAAARSTVLLETFILFEDSVGHQLRDVLVAAARRGVRVAVTVDGFGSSDLSDAYVAELVAAGVQLHVFAPRRRLFGVRTHLFRRMHRKLVAIDGSLAFVGGINFSIEHLAEFGPLAKQDYAVEVEGPIARDVHDFLLASTSAQGEQRASGSWTRKPALTAGHVGEARLVTRDNDRHRRDIEQHYLMAIRMARKELIIANAYFLPGYRLLRAICNAAERGVDVRLILQGNPDMLWVKRAANKLYSHLCGSGVRIFEYCERPFHGKVALVDDDWATVGSSNLDPLSLSLNLEANLVIRDAAFTRQLRGNLDALMASRCKEITAADIPAETMLDTMTTTLMFHFLRRFPAWAGWFPAHSPRLVLPSAEGLAVPTDVVVLKQERAE